MELVHRPNRSVVWRVLLAFLLAAALMLPAPAAGAAESTAPPSSAGEPLTPESAEAFLDAFFASEQAKLQYIGAAVVIVKDGQVVAQKGYGYADAQRQEAVDPAGTVFRLASVSKTFTAVAIMQLAEQGKIDLEADIREYLPDLEYDNPFDVPVTVADLLTHRSGFEVRDPQNEDLHADFDLYVPIEDFVRERMPPVVRKPGTAYMYDNFAYLLLGLIVQNVSGLPYEQYMQEYVFEPLGMTASGFEMKGRFLERLATGYDQANQPIAPYAFVPTIMPHGGMLSTAEDMGKFMLAFLNGGLAPGGARILSEASVAEMGVYRNALHPVLPETTYGFETPFQLPLAGSSDAVLTKLGDLPGSSVMLFVIPEEKTGVFLVANKSGTLRDLFYAQFMMTFFPAYTMPAELPAFGPSPSEELAKLEGVYIDLRAKSLVYRVEANEDGTLTLADAIVGPRILRQVDDGLFVDNLTQRFTAFGTEDGSGTVYMNEPYLNPLGYARKGDAPAGYADVDADGAYAPYILALQSLGHFPNEPGLRFEPGRPVTRAELVYGLLRISGLEGSKAETYAFADVAGHPLAPYVQAAYEMGMVAGDGRGSFAPDRPATRQEAAVMIWNVYRRMFPGELFADIRLADGTAPWAEEAVRMMAGLGLHGPEVARTEDGAVEFRSAAQLTREEEAALMYQLLFQPVNQIVAQLMSQQ
jgi:CubicO group peptidase (beta-lactamase class C family)